MTMIRLGVFAVFALAAMVACGEGIAGIPEDRRSGTIVLSAAVPNPEVSTLVVRVTADDFSDPLLFNVELVDGSGSAVLTIPAGDDRAITVSAFAASGTETHRGSAILDVSPGPNPPAVITLVPLAGHQPIDVVLGEFSIAIQPSAAEVPTGGTVQLIATILDGTGAPFPGSPTWATTNSAIATVDHSGLVSGSAAGTTNIVASFGGVGDFAEVTVTSDAPAGALSVPSTGSHTSGVARFQSFGYTP